MVTNFYVNHINIPFTYLKNNTFCNLNRLKYKFIILKYYHYFDIILMSERYYKIKCKCKDYHTYVK
jgi:hypothetical protein